MEGGGRESGVHCLGLGSTFFIGAFLVVTPLPAEVLFDQLEADVLRGAFADGVPGQTWDQRVAEDFDLKSAATIDRVAFVGGDENFMTPELDNVSSFVIEFYEDEAGEPSTVICTEDIPLEEAVQVFLGLNQIGGETFEFQVDISPVALDAGTYWCSIGGVQIDAMGDGLLWNFTSEVVNNLSATERPFGSGYLLTPLDYSMAFYGTTTCVGDIDGSGALDFGDVLAILAAWGNAGGPEDVDESGVVDFGDILIVLGGWGVCA